MREVYPSLARLAAYCALFVTLGSGLSSCVSPKTIVYFQGEDLKYSSDNITQSYVPTIQSSDLLSIVVGSLSPESNEIFNMPNQFNTSSMNYSATGGGARAQSVGYLVDHEGNIEMPLVGKVNIGGLQTQVASDTIRKKLLAYLREPTVSIRTLNFKVSVLGEVNRPAVYVIPDERITLPEVLSLAGDLTIYGKRDNILIIREENGKREYARVDFTSRDVFRSPYYYLHKNDVIYIEPIKARMTTTDRNVQLIPMITGIVSALGILALNLSRGF
ncbi:polysaccharide biosynthesis/export family protein [Telluribacter sp.]|jgi:polysaccharide export outer membrane protein|uniref:polysaccharide biosynthesis/export family protein n=1 Tax=Telluribacter sp. TaxID=1978767 RepID=UPI002E14623A|nr:polysaccharide biosynthesis/export family protein [Telluribacter sp.]